MAIKKELKAPAKAEEPAAEAAALDSEEEAEARETAVLEEMQVQFVLSLNSRVLSSYWLSAGKRRGGRGAEDCRAGRDAGDFLIQLEFSIGRFSKGLMIRV